MNDEDGVPETDGFQNFLKSDSKQRETKRHSTSGRPFSFFNKDGVRNQMGVFEVFFRFKRELSLLGIDPSDKLGQLKNQ